MNIAQKSQIEFSSKFTPWLLAARPKTLPAAVSPVLLGCSLAYNVGLFQWVPAILCLLFALLIQIGCNYANDYYDFIKGVDTKERIGIKRAVFSGWIKSDHMKRGMIVVLTAALLVGSGLIFYGGLWLIVVGLASVICAVAYTAGPYPIGYNGFGDIFVFIFFGLIAVLFTFYVQAGYFSIASFWVAVSCGLLAANIRVVNDIRDKETDAAAGKKTWAVRFGRSFCYQQYLVSFGMAIATPLVLLTLGMHFWVLLPILVAPLGLNLTVQLFNANAGQVYDNLLAKTAQLLLLYSILLSIGIILSR